jgi:hypothetical protein
MGPCTTTSICSRQLHPSANSHCPLAAGALEPDNSAGSQGVVLHPHTCFSSIECRSGSATRSRHAQIVSVSRRRRMRPTALSAHRCLAAASSLRSAPAPHHRALSSCWRPWQPQPIYGPLVAGQSPCQGGMGLCGPCSPPLRQGGEYTSATHGLSPPPQVINLKAQHRRPSQVPSTNSSIAHRRCSQAARAARSSARSRRSTRCRNMRWLCSSASCTCRGMGHRDAPLQRRPSPWPYFMHRDAHIAYVQVQPPLS